MRRKGRWIAMPILAALVATGSSDSKDTAGGKPDQAEQWHQWRGPLASGVSPGGNPPVVWSETKNVRFKVPIPGRGHSTPVVFGDRIYVTTAVPHGEPLPVPEELDDGAHDNMPAARKQRFIVLALSRKDGSVIWQRVVRDEQPHEGTHVTGSWASASPVTDGKRVYAFFGSRGLFCLDVDGELLWEVDFGDMKSRHGHGEGSSPALWGNTLVVNWDHQGQSFVVALDARNGKERWRVERDEITSWSTPLIVEHGGKRQVVISATARVRSYALGSGKLLWECGGLSRNVVATPVSRDGLVYVGNSYDHRALMAIRLDRAKGDVTGTDAVVWKTNRDTPYVPSPLLYDEHLCFLKHNQGFLTCLVAETGEPAFGPQRLRGIQSVFASPVGAADRIYVTSRNGSTAVVERGGEFGLLALNWLEDSFSASPAIAGDELFLRGESHLYCLARE